MGKRHSCGGGKSGLMTFLGANHFVPNDQATRAEAVTVLLKLTAMNK
jgi:hypothetical protein